jgi:FkbM family methyltransferase
MKKKIVFIAPHLSTGGLPQYLVKQVESIKDEMDVYCIEWDNVTGGVLVVQRNKMVNLLGDRLITFGENKRELFSIINKLNPDIIHLQEIPELFMAEEIADELYSVNRSYVLIETSHDSAYNVDSKKYFPDKFLMVSEYQIKKYKKFDIPIDLVEYPIENKVRTKTREQALRDLGLDPNLKHVINIGLFTPRKNQAEIIEYARQLQNYPIQFHFIGNQADNFKYYWEPLMRNLPSNCKWWNERSDVDAFYAAADLFLFTSRGNPSDMETMPLVIREALSWKTPSLIYNLPVYMGYFDKYDTIEYLQDDIQTNVYRIAEKLLSTNERITPITTYTEVQKPEFTSRWDLTTQTIYFSTKNDISYPTLVSLKEYKTDSVLWSMIMDTTPADTEFWMIPVSKAHHSYENDPNFMGVKLCIYNNETGEQLYEYPYIHKFVNLPTVTLSNSIPYHFNYMEYFVHKKYSRWLDRPYKTVVDVGANVGVFSSYMMVNNNVSKIIAIECDKVAIKDLQNNFKHNTTVTILPKALHTSSIPITFYHSPDNPVISSTLAPDDIELHRAGIKGNVTYTVPTVTLRQLVDEYGEIDLLKIDIEGAEYDIISHTDSYVFDKINNIFVECHFFKKEYKEQYKNLINKLESMGYFIEEYQQNQVHDAKLEGGSECIFATKTILTT